MDAILRGRSKTNTFAYIHIGAKHMIRQAGASSDGQLYNLISCLVLSAFTLEAYFNHFGKLENPNWEKEERNYPKLKKFKMFCSKYMVEYNLKERPYSTIIELFNFRDTMAHGKSTIDAINKNVTIDHLHPNRFTAGPQWMEYATIDNAKKAIEDVEMIIKELHAKRGLPGNPFSDLGGGMYGVQRI